MVAGLGRVEQPILELSPVAIEEAIVNAVYHRSYEVREPIEMHITAEDLVVLSFPGPIVRSRWTPCAPVRSSAATIATGASASFSKSST